MNTHDAAFDWSQVSRVLCVRLDNMGDVLMSTPAIRALKHALPGRRIDLWCSPSGKAVAHMIPEIDNTLCTAVPWMKVSDPGPDGVSAIVAALRAGNYDAAVIFTVYTQSALPAAVYCHMAGIPRVLAHCRENPYHLIGDWVVESEPGESIRHEVRRQLELVEHVGAVTTETQLSLSIRERDRAGMRRKLKERGVTDMSGWIVAHVGATAASRRYPAARFASAIAGLVRRHGAVMLTGAREERELVAEVAARAGAGAINLAGDLTLSETGALIADASVLVSNNSGPAHMAAALGTPVVVLYALTNPQHTPWGVRQRVLYRDVPCRYCYRSICPQGHHACLATVMPEEIELAVQELLEGTAAGIEFDSTALPPLPAPLPGRRQRPGAVIPILG